MSNVARAEKLPAAAATKPERAESEIRRAVRLLGRFLVGQRKQFVMAMLMLIVEAWSATRVPLAIGFLIDYLTQRIAFLNGAASTANPLSPFQLFGLPTLIHPDIDTVALVTIVVVLLTLLNSACDSFAEIYLANGGRLLGNNLRVGLYSHLQKLSLAFYSKQRTGDLLTRVTGDVAAIEEFVIKSLSDIVGSFLLIGFIIYTMIVGAWQVAIIAALIIPIMALISSYFSQRIKVTSKKQRAGEGDLAAAAQQMLTSIRVIQTYGSGGDELNRFAAQSRKTMDSMLEAARLQAVFSATVSTLESVAVALVIWLAVYLIFGSISLSTGFGLVSTGFSIGLLTVYTKYVADMFKPTKKIIKEWSTFGKIYASVERIGELMDRKPAVEDLPSAVKATQFEGHVAFNHVSFAYMPEPEDIKDGHAPEPKLALRDVNFTIAPGEVVALVGASGAGKSTIVQLLPRLYDPHAGAITIDGQDIRSFTLDSLRAQMSMVLQEAILFAGTVAENIAYGRPGATREEIIAAAIQANAHEFIEQMPDGYETELSERASNLSGGQRQRVAIARAFIRGTPILILDEPTTGLDAESTDLVLLALQTLMQGKATLIISHDLNLIRQADKIVVIKEGQIVQVGTHRALLKVGGLYADLYNKQFGQAVEEQGATIKPIETPKPIDEVDQDEEAEPVSPQIFQTLMGRALPAPASPKAFQTLMMQAVPAAQMVQPEAQPRPAGSQARGPAIAPQAAQPAPATPKAAPSPAIAPGATASPAPQTGQPAAAAQAAPASRPAPRPSLEVGGTQAPALSTPAAAAPVAKAQPNKPQPAIFETTVSRPAARKTADGSDHTDGASGIRAEDLTFTNEMRAIQAQQSARPTPQVVSGSSGLRGEPLVLLNSPVIQRELPSLRAAFDTATMRNHIQATLLVKAGPDIGIETCKVDQATYLPDQGVEIRYEVSLKDRATKDTRTSIVVGMIFPTQLACALYMRDKLAPLVELMRGRDEIAPFSMPAAVVEPLNMALHVFPIDGELPTLVTATDPQRMRAVLNETLPQALDSTLVVGGCAVELEHYAPRYRAVLRYQIEGRRQNGRAERQTVYGKVFAGSGGALAGPVTAALRERLVNANGDYRFNVPRSLGWRPDLHLALLEAVPGKPLIADALKARFKGQATEPGTLPLEALIDICARVAATLHTSNVKLGRRRTIDDEIAALRKGFSDIQRISPELGTLLDAWLRQLSVYAEESDPLHPSFCHGDYTYTQLIFEGTAAGLIDFDSVCQAEPALDLGQFLASLCLAGFEAQQLAGHNTKSSIDGLCERFLSSYLVAMGDRVQDVERLRVRVAAYHLIGLLRGTLRNWQQFKTSRLEYALGLIEEQIARLPQLDY